MALDYVRVTDEIIKNVGGVGNIAAATNCMTRLRLTLKDEGKADDEAVKGIKGVKGVMKQGGQYQIIIGNEVADLFKEFKTRGNWGAEGGSAPAKPTGNVAQRLMGFVSGCVTPLLPAMLGTGMLKVVLTLLTTFAGMDSTSSTYIIIYSVADSFYYFLPIFLGFNIAKKMGGNPSLYMAVGAALCYPGLVSLLGAPTGTFLGMDCVYFFGIPVICATYTSSLLPMLLMAPVMKWAEDFADRVSPNVLKSFLKPLLFFVICTPCVMYVLGPLGYFIGNLLSNVFSVMYNTAPWLTVGVLSAIMPFIVMTGMHYALAPLCTNNFATLGYDVIVLVTMFASNVAQGAATFGVAAKTKNEETRSDGIACGISAVVAGVTEPAMYGINLRYGKPMVAAVIAAGIGGLFCGLTGVKGYSMGGSPSALSLIQFIDGDEPMHGVIFGAIALVIILVVGFALSFMLYNDPKVEESEESSAAAPAAPTAPKAFDIYAPIAGVVKPLNECTDEVFAAGTLGQGIVIDPIEGKVYAPCDGEISSLFDTLHAIGITSAEGAELLIHVGMDTVNLGGKGFTAHCKTGDTVKKGDLLLEFDIDYIRSQGLQTFTPFVITNADEYVSIKPHYGMVNPGECVISISNEAEETTAGGEIICAPISGEVRPLSECPDKLFSSGAMGQGFVLEPSEGKVYAPCDGKVKDLFETLHALGITSDGGAEVLLHIGMNTVDLHAMGFTAHCKAGDAVKKGDLLIEFDIPFIKTKNLPVTTPVIITNGDEYSLMMLKKMGSVNHGDEVLELKA